MGCHFKLSLASPRQEILRRAVSVGSNFAGGSIWPQATNTRAAILASSRLSDQHWTHLLQRHKPHVILLLLSLSWTFPLLLNCFSSGHRTGSENMISETVSCSTQQRPVQMSFLFFCCFFFNLFPSHYYSTDRWLPVSIRNKPPDSIWGRTV